MKEKVNNNILVQISKDGMEAYITITFDEANEEDFNISYENIISVIKEKVKYGLQEEVVKNLINNKMYNEEICIAKGLPPKHGEDGKVKYYFEVNKKISPKVNDDGSVDYRELDIVNNVKKGDLLAEIILPIDGELGIKVTGEEVDYKKGKVPFIKQGKNIEVVNDGLSFLAAKDGMAKLINNKISVLDVFEVPAVDNSTGNVYFNGTVIVKGNVINGFKLEASGDLDINGVVEGAYINNEGNILIRRGIQGYGKAQIYTEGKLTTRFIENASIKAGNVITAEAIMHSEVESYDGINLIGKRGLIVGGICKARRHIHAITVGSSMATVTTLEVGVDTNLNIKYDKLMENNKGLEENYNKVNKSIGILETMMESGKADESKIQLYKKLLNTRNSLEEEINKINSELSVLQNQIEALCNGEIKVEGTVYPGVRIVIGNEMKVIKDEIEHCSFYLEDGEVKIGPY